MPLSFKFKKKKEQVIRINVKPPSLYVGCHSILFRGSIYCRLHYPGHPCSFLFKFPNEGNRNVSFNLTFFKHYFFFSLVGDISRNKKSSLNLHYKEQWRHCEASLTHSFTDHLCREDSGSAWAVSLQGGPLVLEVNW